MTTGPALLNLVDETIEALSRLDCDALDVLEQRASALATSPLSMNSETTTASLLQKARLLAQFIEDTAANLAVLCRLRATKEEIKWAR